MIPAAFPILTSPFSSSESPLGFKMQLILVKDDWLDDYFDYLPFDSYFGKNSSTIFDSSFSFEFSWFLCINDN